MEEQLVSFETAKLAQEKGFNETTNTWYDKEGDGPYMEGIERSTSYKYAIVGSCYAPTQALLQKWLREVHGIFICMQLGCGSATWYTYMLQSMEDKILSEVDRSWDTYEEALEAALVESLKLIL